MKLPGNWGKDADRPIDLSLTPKAFAALARAEREQAAKQEAANETKAQNANKK